MTLCHLFAQFVFQLQLRAQFAFQLQLPANSPSSSRCLRINLSNCSSLMSIFCLSLRYSVLAFLYSFLSSVLVANDEHAIYFYLDRCANGDLSAGLETTRASVIVRRRAQKSSTMRGSQAQLPLDSGKTRLNDVNTYPRKSPTLGYTCTAMSPPAWLHVRSWAPTRRDQRPVHSNAHPTNSHKFTAPTRGHGRQGTASLRDATTLRRLRRRRLEGQCLFTLAEYRKAVECFDKAARPDSGYTTAYASMVGSQKRLKKRPKRDRCFNGSAGPEPDCATAQPYRRCCAQSTPEA